MTRPKWDGTWAAGPHGQSNGMQTDGSNEQSNGKGGRPYVRRQMDEHNEKTAETHAGPIGSQKN